MRRVLGVAGLSALLVFPAAADWLVLRDGSRVETAGPWKTKGRQVIFTRAGGSLSALRLADVDLEASAEATAASEVAAAEAAAGESAAGEAKPRRRASVMVLTDEDIRSADEASDDLESEAEESEAEETDGEETGAEEGKKTQTEAAASEPVVLVSWESRDSQNFDGLEIIGSVRNTGDDIAASLSVKIRVQDEDGNPLKDTEAFLQEPSLGPGQSTTFRALLTDVYVLPSDPSFELSSDGFSISGPSRSDDDSDETGSPDSVELGEN